MSLNEIRSGRSSALDSQDRYPSGTLTNGVSTEQLQTLVQTALKVCYAARISACKADQLLQGSVSMKEAQVKPPSSSFKIRIPALAARTGNVTKAAIAPRRSIRQKDGGTNGSETPPPPTSRTADSNDFMSKSVSSMSGISEHALSPEEVASLRAVRDLLARKGERAVLQWLQS